MATISNSNFRRFNFPSGSHASWYAGDPASIVLFNEFFGVQAPPALDVPVVGAVVSKGYDDLDSATTSAITTQATTSILVFAQWETTSTPPTITDSKGNTYGAPLRTTAPGGGSITNFTGVWFITGATGGSAHTFTATGLSDTFPSIWVVEVVDGGSITHIGGTALASPYNSGNLVTTGDTLLIGFAGAENTTTVTHTINTAGFTKIPGIEITNGAAAWTGVVAERSAAAGTYNFEVGVTSSQDGSSILVAIAKGVVSDAGYVPVWLGSWQRKPAKVWTGAAWVIKPAKRYDGATFVTT